MPDSREGLLVPAHIVHQRLAVVPDRARGDLRTGALGAHVPHAGRGGGGSEQHTVRLVCRCLDRQGLAHPVDGRASTSRSRVGEHVQPLRPHVTLRWLQGIRFRPRRRRARSRSLPGPQLMDVRKTYKLFVNGEFVRSESGRAYQPDGTVNVPRGSRKDLRDAVRAARSAFPAWAGRTAMNRGQILYRAAEMLDSRGAQFTDLLGGGAKARRELDQTVETLVWYAGWTDKLPQVAGTVNPVAGPYFNFTLPEPTGVVGIIAPEEPALAGLVRRIAPALCGGNVVVALAPESQPLPALTLAEVFATSDFPAGVVNVLSGQRRELLAWLRAPRGAQRSG